MIFRPPFLPFLTRIIFPTNPISLFSRQCFYSSLDLRWWFGSVARFCHCPGDRALGRLCDLFGISAKCFELFTSEYCARIRSNLLWYTVLWYEIVFKMQLRSLLLLYVKIGSRAIRKNCLWLLTNIFFRVLLYGKDPQNAKSSAISSFGFSDFGVIPNCFCFSKSFVFLPVVLHWSQHFAVVTTSRSILGHQMSEIYRSMVSLPGCP